MNYAAKKIIVIITLTLIATRTQFLHSRVLDVIYNCPPVVKGVDYENYDANGNIVLIIIIVNMIFLLFIIGGIIILAAIL